MTVESRLHALASTELSEDDARAIDELDAFPRPRRRQRARATTAAIVAGVLIFLVLLNVPAAYFAPTYGRALADAPGVGPVSSRWLSAVGLHGGDVTVFGDSATSSGHTLKLEAGFADGLRTVLFVSIDGKGLDGNPKGYGMHTGDWGLDYDHFTLTDQFGHSYTPILAGGSTMVQFSPLVWPASEVGARLTFHETAIAAEWEVPWGTVSGDWTLHATLVGGQAYTLPLPAPVRTTDAIYTFSGIVAAGRTLVVHVVITGPVTKEPPPTGPGAGLDIFRPSVYDAAGGEMQLEEFGVTWPKVLGQPLSGEMTAFIAGPGHYRIVIAGQDRWIVVP
jgi:hypothetical protein